MLDRLRIHRPNHPERAAHRGLLIACASAAVLAGGLLGAKQAAAYGVALQTAVDTSPSGGAYEQRTLAHILQAGAQLVRIGISWSEIAPVNPPSSFAPANPDDPSYRWRTLDKMLADAVARGLTPYITIDGAPTWARVSIDGADSPDPAKLALFAQAIATRYDGSHPGLPWVRYFEVWNEPNLSYFLGPQTQGEQIVSAGIYRTLINEFAAAVHGVRGQDVVIAGALFPNGLRHPDVTAVAALQFTRLVLCLSAAGAPHRVCDTQVHADAWSVHPYTTGGPSTRPANPDNVWISNLGSLTSLVRAAQRLGTLVSAQPVQTWVTEFAWASKPHAPAGVPLALEQRWVAEVLYRSWRSGISVFSWYALRDELGGSTPEYAGLYFDCLGNIACDTPKPALQAFRFPFVAYAARGRLLLWGRTPAGVRAVAMIQLRQGRRWWTLTRLRSDGNGVFTARLPLPRGAQGGVLRALTRGESSPAFSLRSPREIVVSPLGY